VFLARTRDEAIKALKTLSLYDSIVIIQDYIQGSEERSFNIITDKAGALLAGFTLKKIHYLSPSVSTAIKVVKNPPDFEKAVQLIKGLNLTGLFVAIQMKYDTRTSTYKLIEINPRFGQNSRILHSFPGNLAQLSMQAALEMPITHTMDGPKIGWIGVSPMEDLMALGLFLRQKWVTRSIKQYSGNLPSIASMFISYLKLYFAFPTLDYFTAHLFKEFPVVKAHYSKLFRDLDLRNIQLNNWGDLT
jgi:predicted ATP-grasp superfamily ATP-dependent carboligase